MVAQIRRMTYESVFVTEPRCVTIPEAFILGDENTGIYLPPRVFPEALKSAGVSIEDVKVRVGDQRVGYDVSGCIPEHAGKENVTRVVVASCLTAPCDGCIMQSLGTNAHHSLVGTREKPILGRDAPVDVPMPIDPHSGNLDTSHIIYF